MTDGHIRALERSPELRDQIAARAARCRIGDHDLITEEQPVGSERPPGSLTVQTLYVNYARCVNCCEVWPCE